MSTSPAHPRRMPITWQPSRIARIVTARMAGFRPGTSPPPVRIPITPFFAFTFFPCVRRCLMLIQFLFSRHVVDEMVQPIRSGFQNTDAQKSSALGWLCYRSSMSLRIYEASNLAVFKLVSEWDHLLLHDKGADALGV